MTYNSESTYKSFFGGSMTLLYVVAIIVYFGVAIAKAVNQSDYIITNSDRIRDVYGSTSQIKLSA